MRHWRWLALVAVGATPAGANTIEVKTGASEVVSASFAGMAPEAVLDALAGDCVVRGMTIVRRDQFSLSCEDKFAANRYYAGLYQNPRLTVDFTATMALGGAVAQGRSTVTSSNAFGASWQGRGYLFKDAAIMLEENGGADIQGAVISGPDYGFRTYDGPGDLVITAVKAGTPAADAGLKVKDYLLEINGRSVREDGDVAKAFRKAPPGSPIAMKVFRGRVKLDLTLTR